MDSPTPSSQQFRIKVEDESTFSSSKLSPITHNYHQHPLMQLDSLERLAKLLQPTEQCRFVNPGVKVSSEFTHKPVSPDGRDIEQVFEQIETPGSWIALYNVQTNPEYQQFLNEVMGTVAHFLEPGEKVRDVRGFIFISSPPSVTPFHIDRENNFWLQIKGRKTINVWDCTDREVVPAKEIESFISYGSLENVRLKDEFLNRSFEFDCGAGDGVYFPSTTPHMTRSEPRGDDSGSGVAISIGIVFYTDLTRRDAYIHTTNAVLRRLGINPHPPANKSAADLVKYPIGRAIVAYRKRFSGYKVPPGY